MHMDNESTTSYLSVMNSAIRNLCSSSIKEKIIFTRIEKNGSELKACTAILEDPSLVPDARVGELTIAYGSSSRVNDIHCGLYRHFS